MEQIIFMRGEPPIRAMQLRYYMNQCLLERATNEEDLPSFRKPWALPSPATIEQPNAEAGVRSPDALEL